MNSTALCVARSQDVFDNASHEPRLHLGPNQANAEDPRFHRRYNFEGIVVKEKDVPDGKKARLVYYPGIGYFDPVGNEYLETGNPDEFSYEGTLYVTKRLGMERHDVVCFHSYEIDDDGRPMEVNTDPTGARFCPQDANPVYNSCWSSFSHG
jgi:hypothetical protein